jgi:hypothetical protein
MEGIPARNELIGLWNLRVGFPLMNLEEKDGNDAKGGHPSRKKKIVPDG